MKKELLEELKKLAVSAPLTPALDNETNFDKVNKFVLLFNVKEGKNKVSAPLVYKIYAEWSDKPISKYAFLLEFGKLFLSKKENNSTYYELNYKPGALVKKGKELTDLRKNID